jgi:HlyD family secretion protein
MRGGRAGRGGTPGTVWVAEAPGAPPQAVPVRAGMSDGTYTEILGGELRPGQAVVVGTERAAGGAAPTARPF